MEQLISENESHKFEVNRLKDNKAELKKAVSLLETSEAEKVRAIEDLMNIKEDLKIQNKVYIRRPVPSTDQALPSFFYFRIS